MAINQWAIDWLTTNIAHPATRQMIQYAYPRAGLGVFWFDFSAVGAVPKVGYFSLANMDDLILDRERRFAIERLLKTYNPKTEAVAVVVSPLADGQFEITTTLLKING